MESGEISPTFTTVYRTQYLPKHALQSIVLGERLGKKVFVERELSLSNGDYHDWGGLPVGGGSEGRARSIEK